VGFIWKRLLFCKCQISQKKTGRVALVLKVRVVLYVIRKNPPKKRTRDKKHVQTCTREHLRAKPISFLEWDLNGFVFAPSRSRHQRRTSYAGDFAFMLSVARGVRERRESRFRARSAISSRRARKSKNPGVALCACLRTVIVQSFARRRASRAEEIGFARGCSRVHFCTCFLSRVRFLGGFFRITYCRGLHVP
jgi:hypothetical protein